MMIKKIKSQITSITDLTPTAKEVTLSLNEPLNFISGNFVNIFMDISGEKIRRAYSISSSDKDQQKIQLSIRLNPKGKVSPLFWDKNLIGSSVELMGPLGLNTADKMKSNKIFLFGFGIGAGVIKSLVEHFINEPKIEQITVITGSRSITDIVHKDFFDSITQKDKRIEVSYVISQPEKQTPYKTGYLQDHISKYNFDMSDIYVCGQESACNTLVEKIKDTNPINCNYFIEGFH